MKLTLLVLSLLVFHLTGQSFDAILAITWPPGHCEYLASRNRKCDPSISKQWNGRSFTIHGFWPGPRSNQYYGKFSINAANPIKHLYTYWPPRSEAFRGVKKTFKEEYFLWIHEWEKHGKDFADQVLHILGKKSFPSRFNQRNRALQTRYFQDTLDLFLKIRATSLAKNPTTKQELAALLGISDRSFSTRCLPSGNLQELQICVKVMKTGASLTYQIVNCTRMKSNCPGNAVRLNQFR